MRKKIVLVIVIAFLVLIGAVNAVEYDITTFQVSSGVVEPSRPLVYGNYVVWTTWDHVTTSIYDIYVFDIEKNQTTYVGKGDIPDLYGDNIVYKVWGSDQITLYDIPSATKSIIFSVGWPDSLNFGHEVLIHNDLIVFNFYNNTYASQCGFQSDSKSNLHSYNLTSREVNRLNGNCFTLNLWDMYNDIIYLDTQYVSTPNHEIFNLTDGSIIMDYERSGNPNNMGMLYRKYGMKFLSNMSNDRFYLFNMSTGENITIPGSTAEMSNFYADKIVWVEGGKLKLALIEKLNSPPTIDSYTPTNLNLSINESESITFIHTSSDPDGDNLTYSWLLDWVEQTTTQNWTYVTDYNSSGTHNMILVVSDGLANVSQEWGVVVKDVMIIGEPSDPNLTAVVNGTLTVILKQASKVVAEFNYNFSEAPLNITDLFVEKEPASATKAYIIIRGLELQDNNTKTLYMNKLNANLNYVCVKDVDINDISEITNNCQGSDEYIVPCNGNNFSGYSCNKTDGDYVIIGLKHSGIIEYDNSTSTSDTPPSGGGGGGGGGGGSSMPCTENWQCGEWGNCVNELQSRSCTDLNKCGTITNKPEYLQECTLPEPSEKISETGETTEEVVRETTTGLLTRIWNAIKSFPTVIGGVVGIGSNVSDDIIQTEEGMSTINGSNTIGSSNNKKGIIGLMGLVVILFMLFYFKPYKLFKGRLK